MVASIEDRLDQLEERVGKVETSLDRARRPPFALSIEEARLRSLLPANRGPEQIERLNQMIGSFSGPADLSSRLRDYLRGDDK